MGSQILLVEDNELQRVMMLRLLNKKLGYEAISVENGHSVFPALQKNSDIQLILLDLNLPDMNGFDVMELLKRESVKIPVIIITADNEVEQAVRAIKMGAVDFITKPPELERLQASISNALRIGSLTREVSRLQREKTGISRFEDLVGFDSGLRDTIHIARKAAACDIAVLIRGETGTGKELLARAVHGESARNAHPFVAVNCGAIPENLVESTLFGHIKGAFTGAVADSAGKFREADGGTLFLDEIGELPPAAQVKLLRALQQQEVEPVGAPRAAPVNVRIISATNRDLQAEVRAGRFREDLFFRLNVLQLDVLPLRERPQDIVLLANYCLKHVVGQEGLPERTLSSAALAMLERYRWPGNVRELLNAVRRAVVLSESNTLEEKDFKTIAANHSDAASVPAINHPFVRITDDAGMIKSFEKIEREVIAHALALAQGNVTKAAASLGIAKSTFYKKMTAE